MRFVILIVVLAITSTVRAQQPAHRIVWEINAKDTSVHSALFRQINNVLAEAPNTQIEVVFHGNAILVATSDSSLHLDKLKRDMQRGVSFAVCNNSMKRLRVDPSRIVPGVTVVPVAILELVKKQEQGWTYIKAGN